ncbi:MAG: Flp pilus assembly protein CpaB [Rhodospirillales bacterium]|nr:Flp pilus assembly protein CpaB [Rhodospirillales bacterium]
MFRIIILVVALVAGGGAAWIAFAMRAEPQAPVTVQEAPPPATREVLVATADLAPGQVLTKESMRWQSWPESAVLSAYVSRSTRPDALASMVGAVVRSKMIAGEPIRDDKLGPVSAGLLSSMLPAGKRAVAVRITAEKTAGGLILPNDRVDVLHTLESADKPEGQKDYTTRTILTNIVVVAVDQTLNETNKDDKTKAKSAAIGKTVTLELDPRQAELLVAAEASGTISLALRSAADHAEVAPPLPKPVPLKVAAQPASEPVVILRGGGSTATSKSP